MNAWLLRMVLQGSCHSHTNRPRKAWKNGNKHIMDNIFINLNYPWKPTINNSYSTQELAHDTWWHLYKANDHFMKKSQEIFETNMTISKRFENRITSTQKLLTILERYISIPHTILCTNKKCWCMYSHNAINDMRLIS